MDSKKSWIQELFFDSKHIGPMLTTQGLRVEPCAILADWVFLHRHCPRQSFQGGLGINRAALDLS